MAIFLTKLKNYLFAALAIAGAIFGALFLYWRRKAEVNQALLDQQTLNADLKKDDDAIQSNLQKLAAEAEHRKELEKNEPLPDNVQDITDILNRRK